MKGHTDVIISAGGVILKKENNKLKVCLIKKKRRLWVIPRGRVEEGESLEETAEREVKEETGINAKVITKIGETFYNFYSHKDKKLYHRKVVFFLMKYLGGDIRKRDKEADEVSWFALQEAEEKLRYKNEKIIIKKCIELIKEKNIEVENITFN